MPVPTRSGLEQRVEDTNASWNLVIGAFWGFGAWDLELPPPVLLANTDPVCPKPPLVADSPLTLHIGLSILPVTQANDDFAR
jgi:hypothetical protein